MGRSVELAKNFRMISYDSLYCCIYLLCSGVKVLGVGGSLVGVGTSKKLPPVSVAMLILLSPSSDSDLMVTFLLF